MSDIEAKITAFLGKFEDDLDTVEANLEFLLKPQNIDKISEEAEGNKKPVPYVLSAYALTSMLFAYLRSEGKDTSLVMPELARVQKSMQSLKDAKDEKKPLSNNESSVTPEPSNGTKPVRTHTRFDGDDTKKSKATKKSTKSKVEKPSSKKKKTKITRKETK